MYINFLIRIILQNNYTAGHFWSCLDKQAYNIQRYIHFTGFDTMSRCKAYIAVECIIR